MKRTVTVLTALAGLAVVALWLRVGGQGSTVAIAEQAPQQAPAAPQPSGPEKVAFTFENDEKMQEFARLWQQRQGIVLRMTVLQAYWNEEQAALAEVNNKFAADYKLDVAKNYTLDTDRKVLIEREAPPSAGPEAPSGLNQLGAPAPQPAEPTAPPNP